MEVSRPSNWYLPIPEPKIPLVYGFPDHVPSDDSAAPSLTYLDTNAIVSNELPIEPPFLSGPNVPSSADSAGPELIFLSSSPTPSHLPADKHLSISSTNVEPVVVPAAVKVADASPVARRKRSLFY